MVLFCSSCPFRFALLQPVTIAIRLAHKFNDSSFVCEPVEKGCRERGIGKNRVPVAKVQIGGNDHRDLFIQITDQLKKELPASLVNRNSPHLEEIAARFIIHCSPISFWDLHLDRSNIQALYSGPFILKCLPRVVCKQTMCWAFRRYRS